MATFLRLTFSVPFLGFVEEEEDPLFCAAILGEADRSFTSSKVSCFLYWNWMGEPPSSAQSLLHQQLGGGGGLRVNSTLGRE